MVTVTDRTATAWNVIGIGTDACVERWPQCTTVYVEVPEEDRITEESNLLGVLYVFDDGTEQVHVKYEGTTIAEHARAVLDAFENDPDTPGRLAIARRTHIAQTREHLDRATAQLIERRDAYAKAITELEATQADLDLCATDTTRMIPTIVDVAAIARKAQR